MRIVDLHGNRKLGTGSFLLCSCWSSHPDLSRQKPDQWYQLEILQLRLYQTGGDKRVPVSLDCILTTYPDNIICSSDCTLHGTLLSEESIMPLNENTLGEGGGWCTGLLFPGVNCAPQDYCFWGRIDGEELRRHGTRECVQERFAVAVG